MQGDCSVLYEKHHTDLWSGSGTEEVVRGYPVFVAHSCLQMQKSITVTLDRESTTETPSLKYILFGVRWSRPRPASGPCLTVSSSVSVLILAAAAAADLGLHVGPPTPLTEQVACGVTLHQDKWVVGEVVIQQPREEGWAGVKFRMLWMGPAMTF